MTRYATQADLEARFSAGEISALLDTDGDDSPDTGRLDAVIADAGAEIDLALSARYDTPITESCPVLKSICCDLARARLYDDAESEQVMNNARAARSMLKRLATGGGDLIADDGSVVAARGMSTETASSKARTQTRLDMDLEDMVG